MSNREVVMPFVESGRPGLQEGIERRCLCGHVKLRYLLDLQEESLNRQLNIGIWCPGRQPGVGVTGREVEGT